MSLPNKTPSIVIIGAGFAGLSTAKGLARARAQVTVLDRSNHHVFQPLLYQVATATLSPADIASPIRNILRRQKNTEVLLAEVTGVDTTAKQVRYDGGSIFYDYLVIATGARHAYFGHDEWEAFAPGLKSIPDATALRCRILFAFEQAEKEPDPSLRAAWLHFILVGAGPTGVEMAGAIAELSHQVLAGDFRRFDPKDARISLVEAGPRILTTFPEALSRNAAKKLVALGVDVKTNTKVERVTERGVFANGQWLEAHTVIWAAGVHASPAAAWLGVTPDRVGRVEVGPDLTLPGHPEIFVLGDTALVKGPDGKPVPGVAPAALQQGQYAARALRQRLAGKPSSAFHYRDKGNLATIGRSAAVADLGWVRLTGRIAWLAWLAVHIYFLIGFRNRIIVMFQWAWSYFTFQRGARLILPGEEGLSSGAKTLRTSN